MAPIPLLVLVTGWLFLCLAILGTVYVAASIFVFRRFFDGGEEPAARHEAVSLLKPLCGAEPTLRNNLESFLVQEHHGPIQLVCGVAADDDPALDSVESLRAGRPGIEIAAVVSSVRHGTSAKVSNLVNMVGHAAHPIIVLSDSDMVATPTYLARVLQALDQRDVGAVSVLYSGRSDAGFWSRLGAAGVSYQFLPGAVFATALGIADPCMGSTIALERSTMQRIGGLGRFADSLADDYAIGKAVRALRLKVAIPRFVMTHACTETTFRQLWRQEVRWGATVRNIVPLAYVGSIIANPLPLALLGSVLTQDVVTGGSVAAAAVAVRLALMHAVDAQIGARTASRWLLPLRDCLTLAVFVASLCVRTVEWRGRQHSILPAGRIGPDTELVA